MGKQMLLVLRVVLVLHLCCASQSSRAADRQARDVTEAIRAQVELDWLESDRRYSADHAPAGQPVRINDRGVTTRQDAAGAVDAVKNGRFGFHTAVGELDPWWQVDLGRDTELSRVVIFNRTDGGHAARTRNITVQVARSEKPDAFETVYRHDGSVFFGANNNRPLVVQFDDKSVTARIVRLQVAGICHFALDEVEVYAVGNPQRNIAIGKPADQKSVSRHSYPGTVGAPTPNWVPAGGEFLLAHSREIVERAKTLANRLTRQSSPQNSDALSARLRQWESQLDQLESTDSIAFEQRKQVYYSVRQLLREIAFTNPLLQVEQLLFIKRHRGSLAHICDQYYGFTAVPGGGLFVLVDPVGKRPQLVNLLEDKVVANGRLAGRSLEPGAFLSPEISYDGHTILFAYTSNQQAVTTWDEVFPPAPSERQWTTENCYHLFQVNADGNGLTQLTDGPWDDFDPCYLPGGRVAFVSERRGGYVRCGIRACRSFNLCSMLPDGSDLQVLSYFDTNEWHPSVNNDGMLVFTRWDYVDRNTQIAHHLWICHPDGRDARAPHGNYPVHRSDRPWAELSIRAIPGSSKYVATAAPHHGYAFGSLVLIDTQQIDDQANSQVTRLTPEVPFPEAEGPIRINEVYGTPWPLSGDDFLCVYDAQAAHHGIYWIDRWGNRELIYRDPEISCLSPMPLAARPRPPVLPDQTAFDDAGSTSPETATIALMNVYDSDFPWPPGTNIVQLRVIQILPKSTPSRNTPRIGIAEQTNARAVLGTVPVEQDGSAYFEVPAGKLIYFQALDSEGMAIQSMRSGTYVHPGEQLTCQGCHEPKHRSPAWKARIPLALQRKPSQLEGDVDGSHPFNYVRLVQPVLDRHCVSCHEEKKTLDLTGAIQYRPCPRDKQRQVCFTRSYNNLAAQYGFFFHAHSDTTIANIDLPAEAAGRTIAGQFGARAARLMDYLDHRHYGVQMSAADRHRITLWLDCNSPFLGAYEQPEAQAHGAVVRPSLE